MENQRQSQRNPVLRGFLHGVGAHFIYFSFLFCVAGAIQRIFGIDISRIGEDPHLLGYVLVWGAGVVQFGYMVPIYLLAKRRGVDPGVLKGLFLAMALLFLLNAGCWGAVRFNP